MATTYVKPPWFDASNLHAKPARDVDDLADLDLEEDAAWEARRARRRAARVLVGAVVAAVAAASAWIAASPDAREAIWSTLGEASSETGAFEDVEVPPQRDTFEPAKLTLAWALGPAPAERSRAVVDTVAGPVPVTAPGPTLHGDVDDPYAQEPAIDVDRREAPSGDEADGPRPDAFPQDPYGK